MTSLKQSFPSAPIKKTCKIYTETDPVTNIVTYEGRLEDDKRHRTDGPVIIERDAATGFVTEHAWYKDDERFEPSAKVLAAWLKESGERLATSSAPASPTPAGLRSCAPSKFLSRVRT